MSVTTRPRPIRGMNPTSKDLIRMHSGELHRASATAFPEHGNKTALRRTPPANPRRISLTRLRPVAPAHDLPKVAQSQRPSLVEAATFQCYRKTDSAARLGRARQAFGHGCHTGGAPTIADASFPPFNPHGNLQRSEGARDLRPQLWPSPQIYPRGYGLY